jgi:hypothetical protein
MLEFILYPMHIMLGHATSCTLCFDGDTEKGPRIVMACSEMPSLMSVPQALVFGTASRHVVGSESRDVSVHAKVC